MVRPDRVELVVPFGIPEYEARRFLAQHQDWVREKLAVARQRLSAIPTTLSVLSEQGMVPFQGVEREVRLIETVSRQVRATLSDTGVFEIQGPSSALSSEDTIKSALHRALSPWLQAEIKRYVTQWEAVEGLRPRYIRIKRMRSRWGSCGPQGDININWILALMPPEMLEYVVFHELCHLRHRNHSASFWSLVESGIPDWRQRRAWLKKEGGLWVSRFS